jgi:hypothetical protein
VFDDERVPRSGNTRKVAELNIGVAAFVHAESFDQPGLQLEDLVEDVKRAIEQQDRTLGGLTTGNIEATGCQVFEREIGSEQVGVLVTYMVPTADTWGTP